MKKSIIILILYLFIGLNANDHCLHIKENYCNETSTNWIIPICNNATTINNSSDWQQQNCTSSFVDKQVITTSNIEEQNCKQNCTLLLTLKRSFNNHESNCTIIFQQGRRDDDTSACPCFSLKYTNTNCNQTHFLTSLIFVSILAFLTLLFVITIMIALRKKSSLKNASDSDSEEDRITPKKSFHYLPPPRSLTQDDLEHISSLPRQEILLIYFPDNPRFKELNRKFKDWLCSLNLRDVHDLYDEVVNKEDSSSAETWIKNNIYKMEKRFILVCSRLAYNVLTNGVNNGQEHGSVKRQIQLLSTVLKYLQSKMSGNYRNLICVRYEDIRVCDRVKYSSEAFNLVPGTEYVLPQHLEDVYRWIHPRSPKPEAWSMEHNPLVRELNGAIRNYQNHEDNIFTVSFSS